VDNSDKCVVMDITTGPESPDGVSLQVTVGIFKDVGRYKTRRPSAAVGTGYTRSNAG